MKIKARWQQFREKRKQRKPLRRRIMRYGLAGFLIWYLFALPSGFSDSTSTVLLDRNGELLGAKIADDGQWRFPETETVPYKMASCLITFEDKNFRSHIGISLKGIVRALKQNYSKGKVVSGGSTITMQLVRIMRKNPPRTYREKLLEMLLATRMEMHYSKDEILAMYASHAPFGNNVVGLDAAAWRYFGRSSKKLSWAESATLAVLPNAPGLIYPGKNHDRLLAKRDRLLKQLYETKKIDAETYELSLSEPLPDKPLRLPQIASHLLFQNSNEGRKGQVIHSTIDYNLQEKAVNLLQQHQENLRANGIMNGAVLITNVNTGEIVAYAGNTKDEHNENGNDVNCAVAPRSTGSILKPFLYAKCLEEGIITPAMLVNDVPTQFGGFSPKNFANSYDGAIPVNEALSRSLNVPMVHLLNEYGVTRFKDDLQRYGFRSINRSARYYGLSLILGGSEVSLFDLNKVYTQMAQELKFGKAKEITYETGSERAEIQGRRKTNRAAIYSTFDAMIEVNRPDEDNQWKVFSSSQPIAWKTGTSFGFRDAWAVGITPDYVVSVWMGNADGEGRPGLTGVKAAAPLMFNIFRQLPKSAKWFKKPTDEMAGIMICRESGFRASNLCPNGVLRTIPESCKKSPLCPYHIKVHLDRSGSWQADSDCEEVAFLQHKAWFVLPPLMEKYYKGTHPNYVTLPEHKPNCPNQVNEKGFHLVYPRNGAKVYVPVEVDGKRGKMILEATHRNTSQVLFWHLDNIYLGQTREIHQLAVFPKTGKHKLTVIDENGTTVTALFEVLTKNSQRQL